MDKKARLSLLRKEGAKRTTKELAELCDVTQRTIQRDLLELGIEPGQDQSVTDKVKIIKQKQDMSRTRRSERKMAKRIEELEKELEAAGELRKARGHYKIPVSKQSGSQAVAFAVASDWHIEETVIGAQVSGLNEFNEKIAYERVRRFFQHTVKLLKKEQGGTRIGTLVLALLGDMISGGIHDELMESNRLLPTFAAIEMMEHLTSGILYILAETDVKLVIPCCSGNHGRMTAKRRITTEAGNSLERFMYHQLAERFKNEPRVEFVIGDGIHVYVDVFEYRVRFMHGHSLRYAGGVGGIFIPVNKAIAQWDKARRADYTIFGHFHQLKDGGNWICNGSLVGYNDFALFIKADYEHPRQAFFLIDRDVGKTMVTPIILHMDR